MLFYDGKNSIGNVTVTFSTLDEPKLNRLTRATNLDSSLGLLSSLDLTRTFKTYNDDQSYNFNFDGLNKFKYFVKDPGTTNIVGQKNKRLHLTAIISSFFFMMFFQLPALVVTHGLTYPMYIELNGTEARLHGEAIKAFETVLLDFKITKGISVLILFGSLFLALFFSAQMPNEKDSVAVTPLPNLIKPFNKINARPVEIDIQYETRRNSDNSTTTYDSGFRNAIFEFSKEFNPPVYVTLYFDSNEYLDLENKIE